MIEEEGFSMDLYLAITSAPAPATPGFPRAPPSKLMPIQSFRFVPRRPCCCRNSTSSARAIFCSRFGSDLTRFGPDDEDPSCDNCCCCCCCCFSAFRLVPVVPVSSFWWEGSPEFSAMNLDASALVGKPLNCEFLYPLTYFEKMQTEDRGKTLSGRCGSTTLIGYSDEIFYDLKKHSPAFRTPSSSQRSQFYGLWPRHRTSSWPCFCSCTTMKCDLHS